MCMYAIMSVCMYVYKELNIWADIGNNIFINNLT